MRVRLTTDARDDLDGIFKYLADNSSMAAEAMFLRLDEACRQLGDAARQYPVAFTRGRSELRRRVVGSYNVYFRIEKNDVEVVRIVYGARDATLLFPDD